MVAVNTPYGSTSISLSPPPGLPLIWLSHKDQITYVGPSVPQKDGTSEMPSLTTLSRDSFPPLQTNSWECIEVGACMWIRDLPEKSRRAVMCVASYRFDDLLVDDGLSRKGNSVGRG